jgi:hypothetical protein
MDRAIAGVPSVALGPKLADRQWHAIHVPAT